MTRIIVGIRVDEKRSLQPSKCIDEWALRDVKRALNLRSSAASPTGAWSNHQWPRDTAIREVVFAALRAAFAHAGFLLEASTPSHSRKSINRCAMAGTQAPAQCGA